MAKAVKAPIRTKTEASRDVYDGAEGGAVADEAWFNAQNPNRCHLAVPLRQQLFLTPKLLSHSFAH